MKTTITAALLRLSLGWKEDQEDQPLMITGFYRTIIVFSHKAIEVIFNDREGFETVHVLTDDGDYVDFYKIKTMQGLDDLRRLLYGE